MFYLVLVGLAVPSPFLGIAEPVAVIVGLHGVHSWVITGLSLAVGQTLCFVLLYFFGERVLGKVPGLRRQLDRIDPEWFRPKAPYLLAAGAVVGLPPLNAMSALSPLVGQRFLGFLLITFIGRSIRFGIFAGTPIFFAQYIGTDWLPEWVSACLQ